MDDDSFDPRKWARPPQAPPAPAAEPGPAAPASAESSLPKAWRGIGRTGSLPPSPKAAHAEAVPSRRARPLALWLLSALLLAGGASAAWLTREPPPPDTAQPIAPRPAEPNAVHRTLNLASVADLSEALTVNGVPAADAQAAAQAAQGTMTHEGEIRAVIDLLPEGKGFRLERLQASYPDGSGYVVARAADGTFASRAVAAELTRQIKVLRGELDSDSFYSSAVSAGLLDTLVPEFINAFAFDFNLASEVSPGDTFEVAFEQSVNADGEAVGKPQLLYASLTTPAKSRALYRFQAPGGEAGWYDGNGGSIKHGFMRTPIDGARITSKFGMRFHPVLHYTRMHKGVDFAAPIGTPIYAAADGTVSTASPNPCGGNWVIIDHAKSMQTRYFHLSRYAEGLHAGELVSQGQTIGYVGVTGTCTTGPHLHYETLINGEHVDPLSIPVDDASRKLLEGPVLAAFLKERDRIDVARAQQAM